MAQLERGRQNFSALLSARSPEFSQHTPRLRKWENVSEYNLAIFPGLEPHRENAPASICLILNSQTHACLKQLSPVTNYLGIGKRVFLISSSSHPHPPPCGPEKPPS